MRRSILVIFVLALLAAAPLQQARAATTRWTNPAGGDWWDANNWSNGVPNANTDAVIDLAGAYTVTAGCSGSSSARASRLSIGGGPTLRLVSDGCGLDAWRVEVQDGGRIEVDEGAALDASLLDVSGTVRVGSASRLGKLGIGSQATVNANGTLLLVNASVTAPIADPRRSLDVDAGGRLEIGSASFSLLDVEVRGDMVLRAGGAVRLSSSSFNMVTKTATALGDFRITTGDGAAALSGPLRKTGGAGESLITVPITDISLTIEQGTVRLTGGGELAGTHTISPNAALVFAGSTFTFRGDQTTTSTSFSGGGTVRVEDATLEIGQPVAIWPDTTFTVASPDARLRGTGTITCEGAFRMEGGRIEEAVSVTVTKAGSSFLWTGGRLTGTGTVTTDLTTARIGPGSGSALVLDRRFTHSGFTPLAIQRDFEIGDNGSLEGPVAIAGTIDITGSGTLRARADKITVTPAADGRVRLFPLLDLQGGTLDLTQGEMEVHRLSCQGTLATGAGGTIFLWPSLTSDTISLRPGCRTGGSGGRVVVRSGTPVRVEGGAVVTGTNLEIDGGTVTGDGTLKVGKLVVRSGAIEGNVAVEVPDSTGAPGAGGSLEWSGGAMRGSAGTTVARDATARITGGDLERTLENRGAVVLAGSLGVGKTGRFVNLDGGRVRFEKPVGGVPSFSSVDGAAGLVVNHGTMTQEDPDLLTRFEVPMANHGLLEVLRGGMEFYRTLLEVGMSGAVSFGISGTRPGAYGWLEVQDLRLHDRSRLAATLGNGFVPAYGSVFPVIAVTRTGSRTGDFGDRLLPPLFQSRWQDRELQLLVNGGYTVTLSPGHAVLDARPGTEAVLSATVLRNGRPEDFIGVFCEVTGGPNTGATAQDVVDPTGTAELRYTGNGTPGTDTVRAWIVVGGVKIFADEVTVEWRQRRADLAVSQLILQGDTPRAEVSTHGGTPLTVMAVNNGPDRATGVRVEVRLPEGLAMRSCRTPRGTTTVQRTDGGDTVIDWRIGTLAANESATLTVLVRGKGVLPQTIMSTVSGEPGVQQDPDPSNDTNTLTVAIVEPDVDLAVAITPMDNAGAVFDAGHAPAQDDTVFYRVAIRNTGTDRAEGVVLRFACRPLDVIPNPTPPATGRLVPSYHWNGKAWRVRWEIGALAAREERSLVLPVRATIPGPLTAVATGDAANLPPSPLPPMGISFLTVRPSAQQQPADTDQDGMPDSREAGDGNRDGIDDGRQANVATEPLRGTVQGPDGTTVSTRPVTTDVPQLPGDGVARARVLVPDTVQEVTVTGVQENGTVDMGYFPFAGTDENPPAVPEGCEPWFLYPGTGDTPSWQPGSRPDPSSSFFGPAVVPIRVTDNGPEDRDPDPGAIETTFGLVCPQRRLSPPSCDYRPGHSTGDTGDPYYDEYLGWTVVFGPEDYGSWTADQPLPASGGELDCSLRLEDVSGNPALDEPVTAEVVAGRAEVLGVTKNKDGTYGLRIRLPRTGGSGGADVEVKAPFGGARTLLRLPIVLAGDLDGDGDRDLADLIRMLQLQTGTGGGDPGTAYRGDLDGDGRLTPADAVREAGFVAGVL